jgi:mRNA interferase RelE/StbE
LVSGYSITITRTAQKEILHLPAKIRRQVETTIDRLLSTMNSGEHPQDVRPLHGEPDAYRIDSGEYRVLFYFDSSTKLITVSRVRHRREVYRNL